MGFIIKLKITCRMTTVTTDNSNNQKVKMYYARTPRNRQKLKRICVDLDNLDYFLFFIYYFFRTFNPNNVPKTPPTYLFR